ncbi:MAG: hypothetical protein WCK05_00605 [Planctomycetota bacterium]
MGRSQSITGPDLADIFAKACQARASASVCIHYQNRCLTYASRLLAIAAGKFIIETPAPVDGQSLEQAATGEGCFVSFRHREHRYFLVARAMGDTVHVEKDGRRKCRSPRRSTARSGERSSGWMCPRRR